MSDKTIKSYEVSGFDTVNRIDSDKKRGIVSCQGNYKD